MRDQYELTVIVSHYNQERHLSGTLNSIFNQKVNFPFKVMITDDHSCIGRSEEIIRDYEEKHSNVEVILAEENQGYLSNILRAKTKTKTRYFCLLDVDDYWTDPYFLQRAYDFLETHEEYSVYEANVEVLTEDGVSRYPFVSPKLKTGTYTKEMLLKNKSVPITQTTGMVFRNCIFMNGIPEVMEKAVGTRAERSFEGDTGRFIMHLKEGPAYYDCSTVGVYRLTEDGIWNSLSKAKKMIISARLYFDLYQYYDSNVDFFVNKAFIFLKAYVAEKQRELVGLMKKDEFLDEYERLMLDDVYGFCKRYENEIMVEKHRIKEKVKKIGHIIRE